MMIAKALSPIVFLGAGAAFAVGCESQSGSDERVCFAQFNIWELSRAKLDQVDVVGRGTSPQLQKAAEVIQRVRPDVLLINEIDYDETERLNLQLFQERTWVFRSAVMRPSTSRTLSSNL